MAKPVVDGLEQKTKGRLNVAHVDIGDEAGGALARKHGVGAVPAFVVLDGSGRVVYRKIGGKPDVEAVERLIDSPIAP